MSVTKRRRQAINRRRWIGELRDRWDLRLQRIPLDATSVMKCSCGGVVYLTGDPTPEDREWFDEQCAAHDCCDDLQAATS